MMLPAKTILVCAILPWTALSMRADYLAHLRRETVEVFQHGFSNYMKHAFPEDELRPLTCGPLSRDRENPGHIGLNDALGNYSLTLIDSLSTLAILAGGPDDGSYTGPQALHDFQNGVAQFVELYGDGRAGHSRKGKRATGFDLDSKVQVFETVIRGVGGLLSAHLFAIGELPIRGYDPKPERAAVKDDPLELPPISWAGGFKYDGQLLRLALDLSERLLPAFYTETGIPYPRVNLRQGIPFYRNSPLHGKPDELRQEDKTPEITETCSAGAGSLILEFTVLSRLTGDARFEQAAKRAFWQVWARRSDIGLIGNGIDPERGVWIGSHAGIGAGMDSFFEYALKSHILLSGQGMPNSSTTSRQSKTSWLDPNSLHPPLPSELHASEAFLEAWHLAHASVKEHLYTDRNHYPYYSNNHRATGQPFTMWIDSLGAFYPGLLALAGEVEEAIEANLVYTALWTRYSALPERWSISLSNVDNGLGWWPGRPEFIESTYYIYRATKDPWYLHVGEMVLKDIKRRCRAPCGWAGLQDVRTGEKQDRMESFFLGETTKYMYLLFDPDHALNKLDAAYVFTTEGHPLVIPKPTRRNGTKKRLSLRKEVATYKYYNQAFTNSCPVPVAHQGLAGSVTAARPDLFQASRLTDLHKTPNLHGPVEVIQVDDREQGRIVKKYKPLSNYTIFPWTLPPTLLPENGSCLAPPERIISWIEFPAGDLSSTIKSKFANQLVWQRREGPTVKHVEGLKLQLERFSSETDQHSWWITNVGNTQLGKNDRVHFYAEHVRHLSENAFSCIRQQDAVEVEVLMAPPEPESTTCTAAIESMETSTTLSEAVAQTSVISGAEPESILRSLLRAVSSVFDPSITSLPNPEDKDGPQILAWEGFTAAGPGAFPLPGIPDTPTAANPFFNAKNPAGNFPWKSIFFAGHACDGPLPDTASHQHQVIVMVRGGCSFSDKIENIPSFTKRSSALQVVIIVDENEAADEPPIRPYLDKEQVTPSGLTRLNGVPVVLMHAGPGDYEALRRAVGIGMRRRYWVESQGFKIENAIVI